MRLWGASCDVMRFEMALRLTGNFLTSSVARRYVFEADLRIELVVTEWLLVVPWWGSRGLRKTDSAVL